MKNGIKAIIGIAGVVAIIGLVIACNNETVHTCSFGEWQTKTSATCIAKETQERTCSSCVKTETREVGEFDLINGHDWDNYEGTEPSCLVDGEGTATCKLCSEEDDITKPKLGHSFTVYISNDNATCLEDGTETAICDRCPVEDERTEEDTALGHDMEVSGEVTQAATCTEDGIGKKECSICDHTEPYGVIDAPGHIFNDWSQTRAATCTVENQETRTCTLDCGEIGHTETQSTVAALGHQIINWSTYNTTTGHVSCDRSGCTGGIARLGDTGPAGGKIIYIAPTGFQVTSTTAAFTTYTAYYLEAAPANAVGGTTGEQTTMRWSTQTSSALYPDVTGTLLTIGSGRNNTALIIAAETAAYPDNTYIYAALAANNYRATGFETFTDWFLPSRDELLQLYYLSSDFGGLLGFFWSSSQANSNSAWMRNFINGNQSNGMKNVLNDVRAVRAF